MSEKQRVMILEDNAMMRSLLQTLLELEKFQVICPAFPIVDAVKEIRGINPSIILLDINLPNINGISLMQNIRSTDDIKDTKVIMSSGSDRKQECLAAGANSFLMKPYMPDDLINLVKKLLNE
jgi:CheY-like chemotaxis protein